MIDANRVIKAPELNRIVIGVDPAVTANETSDSTGIVVAGQDARGHYYILSDRTTEKASPQVWGNAVVTAYHEYKADRVIGEVNQGGDLVERNIRVIEPALSYKSVRATRGKLMRAEPIANLYEQGKVHHVGSFPELEDEMCNYNPMMEDMPSPDRLDALVWAMTELSARAAAVHVSGITRKW
jgi:phage terminase large subunit-like protein